MRRLVVIVLAVVVLSGTTAAAFSCEGFEPNGNPTHADKAIQPEPKQTERRRQTLHFSCDWAYGESSQDVNIRYRADGVAGGGWQYWNGRKGPFKAHVDGWPGGSAEMYATIHEKHVLHCEVYWGDVSDAGNAPWKDGGGTVWVHIDTVGDQHNQA